MKSVMAEQLKASNRVWVRILDVTQCFFEQDTSQGVEKIEGMLLAQ